VCDRPGLTGPVERTGPLAAVTGANGYIGSIVTGALSAQGFTVRSLIRRPEPGSNDRYYDIASACRPEALEGVDLLVHCAYDFSLTTRSDVWSTNVYGTRALLDLAVQCGVRRTIVLSSMSAYAGTTQIYGRAKLATEGDALARGMCAVRPGLVYGPGWGGMAGTLRSLTSLPLVPLVGREARQFTVHEEDLGWAVATLAQADQLPPRPLGLAHPESVSFQALLSAISSAGSGRTPRYISLPWQPLYWAIRAAEVANVNLPVRADSLLGLVRSAPSVPNPDDLRDLGIALRPFSL
jgi:nucleoside-diphosphate-sugar epimerase